METNKDSKGTGILVGILAFIGHLFVGLLLLVGSLFALMKLSEFIERKFIRTPERDRKLSKLLKYTAAFLCMMTFIFPVLFHLFLKWFSAV